MYCIEQRRHPFLLHLPSPPFSHAWTHTSTVTPLFPFLFAYCLGSVFSRISSAVSPVCNVRCRDDGVERSVFINSFMINNLIGRHQDDHVQQVDTPTNSGEKMEKNSLKRIVSGEWGMSEVIDHVKHTANHTVRIENLMMAYWLAVPHQRRREVDDQRQSKRRLVCHLRNLLLPHRARGTLTSKPDLHMLAYQA